MSVKNLFPGIILIILSLSMIVSSCSQAGTSTPSATPVVPGGPGGGAIINSDSITTGKIVAIRTNPTGYPVQIDLEVQKSVDVGQLPNPTKDKVGQVITINTDQDVSAFKVGQVITGSIKYAGDVPKPGITLYISGIRPASDTTGIASEPVEGDIEEIEAFA
jgi:hypothetical protein